MSNQRRTQKKTAGKSKKKVGKTRKPKKPERHTKFREHEKFMQQIPADLRVEIEKLMDYETKITRGLKDANIAKLFVKDPSAALKKMKVPQSAGLRKRLNQATRPAELLEKKTFTLPTGQTISPNVKIRITKKGS
jgi:hypothetical protein